MSQLTEARALELFEGYVRSIDCIDYVDPRGIAYASDSHVRDYQTGEFATATYFLDRPTDGPWNGNGSLHQDPVGEPIGEYQVTRIDSVYQPCSNDDPCDGEEGCMDSACIQEPVYQELISTVPLPDDRELED